MKTVTAAEANREFSKIMRAAEDGDTIVVTSHGEPKLTIRKYVPEHPSSELQEFRKALWVEHRERLRKQTPMNLGRFSREWAYED
jgi:prevent-host-death family protein